MSKDKNTEYNPGIGIFLLLFLLACGWSGWYMYEHTSNKLKDQTIHYLCQTDADKDSDYCIGYDKGYETGTNDANNDTKKAQRDQESTDRYIECMSKHPTYSSMDYHGECDNR